MPIISLKQFVDKLEAVNTDTEVYFDKASGDFHYVSLMEGDFLDDQEPDWDNMADWEREEKQAMRAAEAAGTLVKLPTSFDIHEYNIMQDFCYSVRSPQIQSDLLDRIQGSGAFRRFKDGIYRHGIENDWYAYRREALQQIALDWLEAEGIEFTRD